MVAAFFLLVGLALYGDKMFGGLPAYWTTLSVLSLMCAFAAGVFMVLDIIGFKLQKKEQPLDSTQESKSDRSSSIPSNPQSVFRTQHIQIR